ncbi:MAG: NAD+ synthase [Alphaproteobacteria bacterium]|nr:NAD+ synthase [Alphaproteobacteria bacterium]
MARAPDTLKIALAQMNPRVGDISGNLKLARKARTEAAGMGADLVLLSELFITGYPPEDLILKEAFQNAAMAAIEELAAETSDGGPAVLIGTPWTDAGELHNAVALLDAGDVAAVRYKHDLPNYGVFDEKRVFAPGPLPGPVNFRGVRLGVPICEDIWTDEVTECLEETAAEIFLVPNGSPYEADKQDVRLNHVVARVTETGLPLAYLNQMGGQDELVFDGASLVLNADRSLALQMPAFEETIVLTNWSRGDEGWWCEPQDLSTVEEGLESIYLACVQGLRDYVNKTGFPGVVLGLSGGIDSAICAAIAVDALGPEKVHCIMMPYRYTAEDSLSDAQGCAEALGMRYDVVPIADPVEGFMSALEPLFDSLPADVTEENLQSRARGTLLMAVSNKLGSMVVTTGNKSEMSVGYATLYGDMNGGYNPIKDLYKMQVYALSSWRNQKRPKNCLGPDGRVIPENIITKAPTAELREDQTDQDSLPPYEALDDILEGLVEHEQSIDEIAARGHERALVERIEHLLYVAEYKRRQAPPGVKLTSRNFGRDRRYPIVNAFRDRV